MTHPPIQPSAHAHAENITSTPTPTPTTHKAKGPLSHIYSRTKAILRKFFTRLRCRNSRRTSSSSSHYTHQRGTLGGLMDLQDYPTPAEVRGRESIRRLGSGRFWPSPPRPWEEGEDERRRFVVEEIHEVERDESGGRVYELFFEHPDPDPGSTEPPVLVRMRAQLGDIKDKVLMRKPPAPVAAVLLRPGGHGDPDSLVAQQVVLVRRAVRRAELEDSGVPAELEAPAPAHLRPGRERDHRMRMQMHMRKGKGVPSTNHSPESGILRKPLPAQIRPRTANSVRSEQEGRLRVCSSLRQSYAQTTQLPRVQAPAKKPSLHLGPVSCHSHAPVESEA